MSPIPGTNDDDRNMNMREKLRAEARKQAKPIVLGSIAMLVSSYSNQAILRLLGKLLDQKAPKAVSSSGIAVSGIDSSTLSSLAVVVFCGGFASFLRTTMLNRAEDGIASSLRTQAVESLLTTRDLEWFHVESLQDEESDEDQTSKHKKDKKSKEVNGGVGMTPAAIGAVLNDDVSQVAQTLTKKLANMIRSSSACLFSTYHMIRLNHTLFGVSFSVVPLIGTAAVLVRKFVKRTTARQRETSTLAASFIEERVSHIAMVKMSNRELDEVERYTALQQEIVRQGRKVSLANGAFMGFIFAASSSALFMVFNAGGKAVAAGRMTAGELTSFASYTFMLGLGTSGISKSMFDIMKGMVCAKRVFQLTDPPTLEPPLHGEKGQKSGSELDFDLKSENSVFVDNVSFSYKANPNTMVLKDVTMELRRGAVVALVGRNGSGKSTLAGLLAALYKPQSGSIALSNELEIAELGRENQKHVVQLVPQSPAIFNTSILENVRYSNPDATNEEIGLVLKTTNCNSFISKLQGGLNYQVGKDGSKLSGGQRQRIGLARALLTDPLLLVLDEPTSSLDAEGEQAVADAVYACRGQGGSQSRALLLISHRASTLELADTVVVLEQGRIVETGTFKRLSKNKNSKLCELMPDL